MECLVSRTSFWNDEKPAKGCYKREYITHDVRTLDSFEKYVAKFKEDFKTGDSTIVLMTKVIYNVHLTKKVGLSI